MKIKIKKNNFSVFMIFAQKSDQKWPKMAKNDDN